jgi:hypothetical protein
VATVSRAEMERLFELVGDRDDELGELTRKLIGEAIVQSALHGTPLFDEEEIYQ